MKYSSNNKPLQCILTNGACYNGTGTMSIKGVLWHSTGANNPELRRYVQPSSNDANYSKLMTLLGKNAYNNDWNRASIKVGVHAFVGKLASGDITSVQTLPWNYRSWGCGSGSRGSCNSGWIQFEICEDNLSDKTYFNKVYKEACELTAYLCKTYGLNPKGTVTYAGVKVPVILCHKDSNSLGLGSNHGDVLHWFKKHGKTMEDVRNDVYALMYGSSNSITPTKPSESGTNKVIIPSNDGLDEGDIITLAAGATYTSGKAIPAWVIKSTLYVRDIRDNGDIVFSTKPTGAVTGVVNPKYVKEATTTNSFSSYLVRINTAVLNVRSGPSTSYKITTQVKKGGVYTITKEQNGWGYLKSGAGWISLDYVQKV